MKKMTRRKQLKLEKKKRKKKQEHRVANVPELVYKGNKYHKEKYVPILLATETAIFEAFVVSGRRLTDHDVRAALTTLIMRLRKGTVPALEDLSEKERQAFGSEEFLTWNILGHWKRHFEDSPAVGRDSLVGILRTTLGSIDVWGSVSPSSRGYLHYLEGFLEDLGVTVREITPEEADSMLVEWEP